MNYDIIVIGSGPGGYVAAIRAAQLGKKVAIVEKSELGGVCLNWGCIPTKALLKSAQVYEYAAHAVSYGIRIDGTVYPDMNAIVARSRNVADTMSKGVAFLLSKNKVEIIRGTGKLLGNKTVEILPVQDSEFTDPFNITADHIILATGSRPRDIEAIPVNGVDIINSKHALALDKLPESIIVVGSGAIGCEFAYLYASLGSKVTVVEYMPNILPLEDEEVSKYMERTFRKLKATVMTGTTVFSAAVVEPGRCEVRVQGKKGEEILEAEKVLCAVGVKSNLESLGLEEAGIEIVKDKIPVGLYGETAVEGIYAIGDIIPGPALAHVASAEAIRCVEKICGLNPLPVDYSIIPSCVYTTPEVASVGLTEKQALEAGMEIRIGKFPFTASGKATAAGNRDGFVKLIFDAVTDKLIGAHLVGMNVTEMLGEPTLAKTLGATAKVIASTVHAHPTMHEAIMEAAEAAHGSAIHV